MCASRDPSATRSAKNGQPPHCTDHCKGRQCARLPATGGPWAGILAREALNKLILLAPHTRLTQELRPMLTEALGDAAGLTMAVPTMLEVLPKGGSKGAGVR